MDDTIVDVLLVGFLFLQRFRLEREAKVLVELIIIVKTSKRKQTVVLINHQLASSTSNSLLLQNWCKQRLKT